MTVSAIPAYLFRQNSLAGFIVAHGNGLNTLYVSSRKLPSRSCTAHFSAPSLAQLGVLPKREFATPAEVATAFAGIEELVIDATERPILRPQDARDQKTVIVAKSIKMPLKIP